MPTRRCSTRWERLCAPPASDGGAISCLKRGEGVFMSEATARCFFARRLRAQMGSGAVLQGMTREERRAVFSAVIYFLGFSSPSLESLAGGLRDRGFVLGDGETLMRFTVVPVGAPAVGVFSNPRIASAVQSLWRRLCTADATQCVGRSDGQWELTPSGIQAMFRVLHSRDVQAA